MALTKLCATSTGREEELIEKELLLEDTIDEMNGYLQRTAAERLERTAADKSLVNNGQDERRAVMRGRAGRRDAEGMEVGVHSGVGGTSDREVSGASAALSPSHRRARPEHFDDTGIFEVMECLEARNMDLPGRELSFKESKPMHYQNSLPEEREHRLQVNSMRAQRDARMDVEASTARQKPSAMAPFLENLIEKGS